MQKHREKNGIRTIGFQQIYLQIKKFTCAFLIFFLQNHKNECIIKVMKKFIKKGKAFLLRNSVSAFEFDCVHSEVNKTNKNLLQICSFVTALLFFLCNKLSTRKKNSSCYAVNVRFYNFLKPLFNLYWNFQQSSQF